MSIKKIVKLRNIGRFADYSAKGDVQLKALTLVYGANGHGKTTLAGVLRSLVTGDAAYVSERATLGATDGPYAEILLENGLATLAKGKWSATAPNIEIFDTTFVTENVYTGEHVGPEHRKNLYQVIVGASAVALAHEIDDADARGRKLSGTINDVEEKLRRHIQAPFAIDAFVALKPEPDLEEKVKERTTRLNAVRKEREILARPQLDPLASPEFPRKVVDVLAVSVERLSEGAETRVRDHIQKRLDHRGETWLRQGLEYVNDEACPFCTQKLTNVDIVGLYRQHFSSAYREHLVDLERAANVLDQSFGERALAAFQKRAIENDGKIQGWADQADLGYARYERDPLELAWKHLTDLLREAVRRKTANPSDAVVQDAALSAAIRDYEEAAKHLTEHNKQIAKANNQIGDLKKQAAATPADTLEEELRRLRNMQIRQTPEVAALVDELEAARAEKKAIEATKRTKKDALGEMAKAVLEKYETAINRLLMIFGANFTVTGTKPSFAGGKASSTYQISLNNVLLELGDATTPRGKPCFRTVLSTGDKSTLALAFFLARLEQDADIGKKCVVFDDPLSSLDCFRTACTQQEIAKIGGRAEQVIVLSHDAFFLKRIFDAEKASTTCLQVVREGAGYGLKEWNITDYFLKEAHQEYFQMRSYLEDGVPGNGDLTSVARAIRPYLEGHFRHRFPDAFEPNEWLGDMLGKIRDAAPKTQLFAVKSKLSELDAVNDYSKQFHHASTPAPRPTDAELRPFVERTLAYVRGS